jgi:hypothetical protein
VDKGWAATQISAMTPFVILGDADVEALARMPELVAAIERCLPRSQVRAYPRASRPPLGFVFHPFGAGMQGARTGFVDSLTPIPAGRIPEAGSLPGDERRYQHEDEGDCEQQRHGNDDGRRRETRETAKQHSHLHVCLLAVALYDGLFLQARRRLMTACLDGRDRSVNPERLHAKAPTEGERVLALN